MKKRVSSTITAFVLFTLSLGLAPQASLAETIKGMIQKGGANCKMKVMEQFDVPMSDVSVSLGETLQNSINEGETTLKDIQRGGLSFNWEATKDGKKFSGYCDTDGKGKVTEFKQ